MISDSGSHCYTIAISVTFYAVFLGKNHPFPEFCLKKVTKLPINVTSCK